MTPQVTTVAAVSRRAVVRRRLSRSPATRMRLACGCGSARYASNASRSAAVLWLSCLGVRHRSARMTITMRRGAIIGSVRAASMTCLRLASPP